MSVKKIDVTSFIIELNDILNQLLLTNYFIESIIRKIPDFYVPATKKFTGLEENEALLDILVDHLIIHLDKFLEIEKYIHQVEIKTYPKHELTRNLKLLIKPIRKMETKIHQWRNDVVVHSENKTFQFIPYHKLDEDYTTTLRKVFSCSRLLVLYIIGFFQNVPDWESAMLHYHLLKKDVKSDTEFKKWQSDMKKIEKELLQKTNKSLLKNGFDLISSPNYYNYPITFDSKPIRQATN